MPVAIRLLGPEDGAVLHRIADGVFDQPVAARLARDVLVDPRHHLAVAVDDDHVVGFAAGVHYAHCDKPPQLFINEVGVAPTHRRQGIGRRLVQALLQHGRRLGCSEAWVLAEEGNAPARHLYESSGGAESGGRVVMYEFPLEAE